MPGGLCLPSWVLHNSTSDWEWEIHRALHYIIQVQDGDFHVYFREYPLFTEGSRLALPFFPSRCFIFFLQLMRSCAITGVILSEPASVRRPYTSSASNQQCTYGLMGEKKKKVRSPLQISTINTHVKEKSIFLTASVFFMYIVWRLNWYTQWESVSPPEGSTPLNWIQSHERARGTRDCKLPVREEVAHQLWSKSYCEEKHLWTTTNWSVPRCS